jgi:tRNA/tmRNA/rRNA uracil-C5-methylase (TrmA/RlmC/RlmD family)
MGWLSYLDKLDSLTAMTRALAACACVRVVFQVVATEVSKASVVAARHNIAANSAGNIFMARMSSEEFTETWKVKGTRNRWAELAGLV